MSQNGASAARPSVRWVVALGAMAVCGLLAGYLLERGVASYAHTKPPPRPTLALPAAPLPAAAANQPLAPPSADAPTDDGLLPLYPGAQPLPSDAEVSAQGRPLALRTLATVDAPAAVLDFYEKALVENGLPAVGHRFGPDAGYVGFLDPKTYLMHNASVMRLGSQTLITLSSTDPEEMLSTTEAAPASVPSPPGAKGNLVLRFTQQGAAHLSLFTTVPDQSAAAVAEFYRRGLAERGWQVQLESGADGSVQLEAIRPRESATAVLRPQGAGGKGTAVYITLITGA